MMFLSKWCSTSHLVYVQFTLGRGKICRWQIHDTFNYSSFTYRNSILSQRADAPPTYSCSCSSLRITHPSLEQVRNSSLILGCQQPLFNMAVWPCGGTQDGLSSSSRVRRGKKIRGCAMEVRSKARINLKTPEKKWPASLTKHSLNINNNKKKTTACISNDSLEIKTKQKKIVKKRNLAAFKCFKLRDHSSSSHFLYAKISRGKTSS